MRRILKVIPFILIVVVFSSACAHQPQQHDTCRPITLDDYRYEAEYNGVVDNNNLVTGQCVDSDDQPQPDYHAGSDRESARLIGVIVYSILEVVVRGIVYGLAHH